MPVHRCAILIWAVRSKLLKNSSVGLALAVLIWIVFGQTRTYPFVNYDDPGYVTENPNVVGGLTTAGIGWAFTHVHGGNWHPLTSVSHMLDVRLFGLNAGSHHLVNVLLHAAAALLLFLVLQQMTGAFWRSAFVAAVFAIHPLRVESVAWISERKDVLSAVFFMLTLGAYLRYVGKPSVTRYLLLAVVFACGLMCKPMLVTIPFVLLLLDAWPLQRGQMSEVRSLPTDDPAFRRGRRSDLHREAIQRQSWSRLVAEKIPLVILSIASCVATAIAQKEALGSAGTIPFLWQLGNALVSCVTYIGQMFWPWHLAVFYPNPEERLPLWQPIVAAIFLAAITLWTVRGRRCRPYALTGWLWYLVMLAPVLGFIQVGLQGHADRFTYLPQIGLYLAITWGLHDLAGDRGYARLALAIGAGAAVCALTWAARIQTSYWRDSETLWKHALAVTDSNDVAHTNLSEVLMRQGRLTEAVGQAEAAVNIRPDSAQACNNLGAARLRSGQVEEAVFYLNRSLALRPGGVNAAASLAWILATCPDESQRNGARAVALAKFANEQGGGDNPSLLHTLGAAYAENGQFTEAMRAAERALSLATSRGSTLLVTELKLNLENYRQHLPLRDRGLKTRRTREP